MNGVFPKTHFHFGLLLSALLALTGLGMSGCASSRISDAYSMNIAYPETARMDQVRGMAFYSMCHRDQTMRISKIAVGLHLQHGDSFGACAERATHTAPDAATTPAPSHPQQP